MTQLKLPQAWSTTMLVVRSVLPSAFLAGGALRDLDNDRPVKDLDVFFTEEAYELGILEDKLAKLNYFFKNSCNAQYLAGTAGEVDGTTTYAHRPMEGGFEGVLVTLPELNLIQLEKSFNPASIVERVDFGICQIGYDLLGVVTTPAYEFDKVNQRFTLTRAETVDGVKRSIKRYERLSAKYPGWSINVPAEFDALYKAALAEMPLNALKPAEYIADTF